MRAEWLCSQVNGENAIKIEELYRNLGSSTVEMEVMHNGQKEILNLPGQAARGIMVASIFPDSPADDRRPARGQRDLQDRWQGGG